MSDPEKDRVSSVALAEMCPECAGAGVLLNTSDTRDRNKDVTIRAFRLKPRPSSRQAHAKWAKDPGTWHERQGNIIQTCERCEGSGFLASDKTLTADPADPSKA